jgi:Ca2+-binding RTX toxin-like protein
VPVKVHGRADVGCKVFRTLLNNQYALTESYRISSSSSQTQGEVRFAAVPGGGFVAVWMDKGSLNQQGIRAQIFDHNGRPAGSEFLVTQGPGGPPMQPALAALPSGGFIVTWTQENPYPAGFDIKGQVYGASGQPVGSEFVVNTATAGFQLESQVTSLAGGGFVVTWEHAENTGFDHVRAQLFAADGTKVGGEFAATDAKQGDKYTPDVTGLAGGGFVVSWYDVAAEVVDQWGNLSAGSRAQVFDASGNKLGAAFSLNSFFPGNQQSPTLAALPTGGFVAAWSDNGDASYNQPTGNKGIWVQVFDASGGKVGAAIRANSIGTLAAGTPTIEVLAGTGFLVTWHDANPSAENGPGHPRAQFFDFGGNKIGGEFAVTPYLNSTHQQEVAFLTNGTGVFGWTNAVGNNSEVRLSMLLPILHGTEQNDSLSGTDNRDFIMGGGGDDQISGGAEDDGISGGEGNDLLHGGAGSDSLYGNSGQDSLHGEAGNDLLDGGAGADTMQGGTGDDTYYLDEAGDVIVELAGEGRDIVYTSMSYALAADAEVEVLSFLDRASTAALSLSGNDVANLIYGNGGDNILSGGGGSDFLIGGAGNDILIGGTGADTMDGGLGDDVFYIDDAGDEVVEGAGEGRDVVYAGASYNLSILARVEVLSALDLAGTAPISLSGNQFGQIIYGNAGYNNLFGGGGVDALVGGAGDDSYHVDSSDDLVYENEGEGRDVVYASASFALTNQAHVEVLSASSYASLTAISLTGNDFANTIYGNGGSNALVGNGGNDVLLSLSGNDRLFGGAGADEMHGGVGNDEYHVDDANDNVVERASEGRDVVYTSVSFELGASSHVEVLSVNNYASTAALTLAGNGFDNVIHGNAGANVLLGGGGRDVLVGRAGDDSYYVDSADDQIVEAAGGGRDVVYTSSSLALSAGNEVEVLSASDTGATTPLELTGNEFDNLIYGNAGANVIDGKGGNDTLVGLVGADTFAFTTALGSSNVDSIIGFDVASDIISLAGGSGNPFAALSAGEWSASAFTIGSGATTAEHRIIYHSQSGALYYDADGSGEGAAVLFATLAPGLDLAATNFTVTSAPSAGATAKSSGSAEEGIPEWGGYILTDPVDDQFGPVAAEEHGSFASIDQGAFADTGGHNAWFSSDPMFGQQELAPQPFI